MQIPDSFFEDEVRCGFYVPALMKRSWAAQLEVLSEVAKVCEKYQIRWFASYGTLLGAVRHGGFIPWDDDLDIWMLREDYVRFNMIAEKELPKGFYIPKDRDDNTRLQTPLFSGTPVCLEKEHLEQFHDFPFSPGIDIFPLDYLAPDPEDEEFQDNLISIVWHAATNINENNQHSETSEALVTNVEKLLNVTLDREKSLKDQLYVLLENIFSLYKADESKELTLMSWKYTHPGYRFPIEYFEDTVLLPFEFLKIPAPISYDQILRIEYGDYQTPIRNGGCHEYPYYRPIEKELTACGADSILQKYHFSARDLEKRRVDGIRPQKAAQDFVLLTGKIHKNIDQTIQDHQISTARELLEACQNAAIRVGTMIEQVEGEDCVTVKLLEQYCELTYQIHEELTANSATVPEQVQLLIHQRLDDLHASIENSMKDFTACRKEIVFLPYKASLWAPMEPIWKKAMENPDYHVSVIPIPYYYKDSDGCAVNMQYEGNQLPDYVMVTDYNHYDFKNRQPDMIFIHNPYDEYNLTTSVHPFFYASNLKQYTDCLVYLPCFPLDEIAQDDEKSLYNMQYYVAMPGCVHADRVAVPSRQARQLYIDYLTEFAGEDTRPVWEEKIKDGTVQLPPPQGITNGYL